MREERNERGAKIFRGGPDALEQFLGLDVIEHGIAGSGGDGMRLIREAVLEGPRTTFKCRDYVRRHQNRAERSIAARDSLPYQDEVGLDIPVLHRERRASAPHAAHDFVGYEKNLVVTTDFR